MTSSIPDGLAEFLAGPGRQKVTLLDPNRLTPADVAAVPAWWLHAARTAGPAGIRVATDQWQRVLPGVLDDAVALFTERAAGVALGRLPDSWGGHVVLIYVLHGDARRYVCWFGYPPADHLDNRMNVFRPGVKAHLTQVSDDLRTFYTEVHNRFRVVGWGECGLLPLDELFTLDSDADEFEYWGDADHHPDPAQLLRVCTSSNGELCVELGTEHAWLQNDSILEPLGELWPALCAWIRRFTEEMARYPG